LRQFLSEGKVFSGHSCKVVEKSEFNENILRVVKKHFRKGLKKYKSKQKQASKTNTNEELSKSGKKI